LAVFLINSDLSILACIVSTIVYSSRSINKENSLFVCGFFGFYSVVSAFFHWLIEVTNQPNDQERKSVQKKWKMVLSIILSLLILILFFNLYKNANPLFSEFTQFINLDWLSFGWIGFTILGFIISYGLLKNKTIGIISTADIKAGKRIENTFEGSENADEFKIFLGFVIFSVLNLMLLVLNYLDIDNLYITNRMPEGITLSDFVHQAVTNTILSIILAVGFIVWIFKGNLNFSSQGKKIRYLVYGWIGQSLLVVVNTIVRNCWYITEYQLTYLRIGVFVFLLLSIAGLILTYFKLSRNKSTWQLLTQNIELWYFFLIICSFFNWDKIITHYNIDHVSPNKTLDKIYLLNLSDANIPEMVNLYQTNDFNDKEEAAFFRKCDASHKKDRFRQWPSFNLRAYQNAKAVHPFIHKE